MKYKIHRYEVDMTAYPGELERFLNNLKGEIIAIIPNITVWIFWIHRVNFLLIVERVG